MHTDTDTDDPRLVYIQTCIRAHTNTNTQLENHAMDTSLMIITMSARTTHARTHKHIRMQACRCINPWRSRLATQIEQPYIHYIHTYIDTYIHNCVHIGRKARHFDIFQHKSNNQKDRAHTEQACPNFVQSSEYKCECVHVNVYISTSTYKASLIWFLSGQDNLLSTDFVVLMTAFCVCARMSISKVIEPKTSMHQIVSRVVYIYQRIRSYMRVCICIYIYTHTHMHAHIHENQTYTKNADVLDHAPQE